MIGTAIPIAYFELWQWLDLHSWCGERALVSREFLVANTSTRAIVVMDVFRHLISHPIRDLLQMGVDTRVMVTARINRLDRYQE
ncbi:hypothetical protein BSZ32_15255 [Rubritalea profundi]|uniref:Uncharacterized protein n=1 Tax=Rubritalea profundi TaxID=1658618 RepID=A0A2S7U3V7_9BACT|nr:hypothetical protein BSZ32_15255 [Rubritalea profundi]